MIFLAIYLGGVVFSILPIFRAFCDSENITYDGDDADLAMAAFLAVCMAPFWPLAVVMWAVVRLGKPKARK